MLAEKVRDATILNPKSVLSAAGPNRFPTAAPRCRDTGQDLAGSSRFLERLDPAMVLDWSTAAELATSLIPSGDAGSHHASFWIEDGGSRTFSASIWIRRLPSTPPLPNIILSKSSLRGCKKNFRWRTRFHTLCPGSPMGLTPEWRCTGCNVRGTFLAQTPALGLGHHEVLAGF